MKLLLDTHAFLWWDANRTRLTRTVLAACLDPANTLAVSIASAWEIQVKAGLGKLALRVPLPDMLEEQQRRDLRIEPVGVADVLGLAELPALHRDPFDRIIISQARRGGFLLVSCDPQVTRYDVPILW